MATIAMAPAPFTPSMPLTIERLGVSQSLVLDLMLRRLLLEGYTTLGALSERLKLSLSVLEFVFRHMRTQQLVEVRGMIGNDYSFSLSAAGRSLAAERFQVSQYSGPCPVTLNEYTAATTAQAARVNVSRESLREAYSDLVVTNEMLDQLGPAVISQKSVFLFGPTGNGKTSIAERMLRIYDDAVLIPYAVEVDGQIVSLFDPVVHQPLESDRESTDPRWVLCRRPCIAVGGELVSGMLELRLDESSGIYAAPLQMKANNGVFIIDDFGRQLMSPRDLLNRWIVPLDRRVDYLTLQYGVKFQIPFEVMVVFSTNLDPGDLADDAFLRRIHNKIYVPPVQPEVFDVILSRAAHRRGLTLASDVPALLRELCLRDGRAELRACYATDLCDIILNISRYEKTPPSVDKVNLQRATALYFGN